MIVPKEYPKKKIENLLTNQQFLLIFFFSIVTIGLSIYNYLLPTYHTFEGEFHSHYNNYLIFKGSFHHLINQQNLYDYYPKEHFDLYKYSPTFALLMAPIAWLPNVVGLICWNLVNALILFFAMWNLPFNNNSIKYWTLGFVFIALITSIQNSQSNALVAGLLILGFGLAEKHKFLPSVILITLTFFIKLFGIAGLAIFIFYPNKWKTALYIFISFLFLAFLPLIVIPFHLLVELYKSWMTLLLADHSASYGYSVAGIISSLFKLENARYVVLIFGIIGLFVPFIRIKYYSYEIFRLWILANILIWVVIFNHKAESPTFIIAVTGVAIWYFSHKRSIFNLTLTILVFIFTVLSPTDLFPSAVREEIIKPYAVMAIPCFMVWLKVLTDLVRLDIGEVSTNLIKD